MNWGNYQLMVRQQQLSSIKCVLGKPVTPMDKIFATGTTFWGDAYNDALLYTQHMRDDLSTYLFLYMVDPIRVLSFRSEKTLYIMNVFATHHYYREQMEPLYSRFISCLQDLNFCENYDGGDIKDAYQTFFVTMEHIYGQEQLQWWE